MAGFWQTISRNASPGNGKRIQLVLGVGNKVRTARKYLADRAYIAGNVFDAVQDHIVIITENDVAVFAHQAP